MTMQELRSRYTGSFLGMSWMLVIPLIQLAIYTFVFGYIYRVGQGSSMLNYALSLFCGFVPFIMVSESLGAAPNRIIGQPNFVKKVVFPLEILPLVTMCVAAIHALGALVVLGLALCFLGEGLHLTILWLPLLVIAPILLVIGLSWILSSLGVFIRDLTATIQLLIQFVFFLTPITYPLSFVPEKVLTIYRLNPLVGIVENFRRVILGGQEPVLIDVLYPLLCGIVFTIAGFYYFQRLRRTFADVI
jgi:lipopolysaccharide transport system permease protein